MKHLKSISYSLAFCLATLLGTQNSAMAQCITFNPGPTGVGTVNIEAYYTVENVSLTTPPSQAFLTLPSLFLDTVTVGNSTVPAGAYLGWCVDVVNSIGAGPANYNVVMLSSCDPNIGAELAKLGTYPATDTGATAAQWNAVNYILNNKVGSWIDVQVAIWNFVGGPATAANAWEVPLANSANVNAMISAATKNEKSWQPSMGNVEAVILAITPGGANPTQLTMIEVPVPCTQEVCCPPPQQNCQNGGSVWCNAHLTCSPGQACNVYCHNASVTFNCQGGKTYTYCLPDSHVCFSQSSPSCTTPNCCYTADGKWCTTVPCSGDSQIFLTGCGIPWQSAFANCTSVCYTGSFNCDVPGVNCQWQCGACSYNCNLNNCNTVQVKPCYQNYCGWQNSDCAGTPENCKSYCCNGNNNNYNNNNNYCGSFSGGQSFTCNWKW